MTEFLPKPCTTSGPPGQSVPTSPNDSQGQARQDRRHYSHAAWQHPRPDPPKYIISEEHNLPLDARLKYLATKLFEFDLKLLKRLNKPVKKLSPEITSTEAASAQIRIEEFNDVRKQWENIKNHSCGFAGSYLTDKAFIPVWNNAFRDIKTMLSSRKASAVGNNIQVQFQKSLMSYTPLATALEEALIDIASQGLLREDVERSIEARWYFLDNLLDWYFLNQGPNCEDDPSPTRNISSWRAVSIKIREVEKINSISSTNGTVHQSTPNHDLHSYSTASTFLGTTVTPILLSSSIFLCGAILSAAFFAVGYAKSPHKKGSIHDADFWFSVQASIAQVTCLISSTLLTWRTSRALRWYWFLPTGIAGFCTLSTALLYISLPSEWASFSNLVATMLQSILILQHFLFTSAETQEQRDKKMK